VRYLAGCCGRVASRDATCGSGASG